MIYLPATKRWVNLDRVCLVSDYTHYESDKRMVVEFGHSERVLEVRKPEDWAVLVAALEQREEKPFAARA